MPQSIAGYRTRKGHGTCPWARHSNGPRPCPKSPGPWPRPRRFGGQAPWPMGMGAWPPGLSHAPSMSHVLWHVPSPEACPLSRGISFVLVPNNMFRTHVPNKCSERKAPDVVPSEHVPNSARQQHRLQDTPWDMGHEAWATFFPESDERRVLVVDIFSRVQVVFPGAVPSRCGRIENDVFP